MSKKRTTQATAKKVAKKKTAKKTAKKAAAKAKAPEGPPSVQETYAPKNACFGCGPANAKGLGIRSFVEGDTLVAIWTPQKHHEAFKGMLNGGIIGALLDCHSNWASAMYFMKERNLDAPPCTVTAAYSIQLRKPTPSTAPVKLTAKVLESANDRTAVEATLESGGVVCAVCRGSFVAVEQGHPAFHRW